MFLILAVIYIVFISLGLPDSLFGVVWPVVHLDFGIPESFASIYSIVIGICSGGISFVAGKLLRKFGTPKVTFASIFLTAIGLVGISFSGNIVVMMIFSVILGYGAGAIDTGLNNYVSLHYKSRHMNWLHCFWGVGVTASPLIMSVFLAGGSWRGGYRVIAAIQLFIALIVAVSMKKWIKLDTALTPAHEESKSKDKPHLFKMKGVAASIFTLGFYCSMEFTLGTWGASYLVNTHSIAPDTAAKWVSFYFGGIMLGRFVSGFVSMKANDKTLIRAGLTISLFGFIMLVFPTDIVSFFGLLLIGFGFGPVFPCVLHSIPERFGNKYSADLTGYHMGGAYAIGFAVQLAFGYAATGISFKITPFVLMALGLSAIISNETALKKISAGKKTMN